MSEKVDTVNVRTVQLELSKPLPSEAEQHTKGQQTGKGYDTSGYGVAWVEERLNEVLTVHGWECVPKVIWHHESKYAKSGAPKHEFTVEMKMRIKIDGEWTPWRFAVGGHDSKIHGDGLAGAESRAIKKVAAKFGVGNDAYKGLVDPDNKPLDDRAEAATATQVPPVVTEPLEPPSPSPAVDEPDDKTKDTEKIKELQAKLREWSETHISDDRAKQNQLMVAMGAYKLDDGSLNKPDLRSVSLDWLKVMWGKAKKIDDSVDAWEILKEGSYDIWKEKLEMAHSSEPPLTDEDIPF